MRLVMKLQIQGITDVRTPISNIFLTRVEWLILSKALLKSVSRMVWTFLGISALRNKELVIVVK